MSQYQEQYGQQYSNQQGLYESGLTMEGQQPPVYNEQQYGRVPTHGTDSYYSPPPAQQAQVYDPNMYSQQGMSIA